MYQSDLLMRNCTAGMCCKELDVEATKCIDEKLYQLDMKLECVLVAFQESGMRETECRVHMLQES